MNEANIYTSAVMLKCVFKLLSFMEQRNMKKSPKTFVVDKWKLHRLS